MVGVPFVADLRTVLRVRDFRRLFAVRLVSQAGDGAFQVALASLVFFSPERSATAGAAAAAFAVMALPYTLVGPFAGVLLDRWRRRQVLLVANGFRALLVVAVAAVVAFASVGPLLYVMVLACLSINRFFLTALGASLPHVVVRDELVMANALSPTSGTLAAIVGGGLSYLLRSRLPSGDFGDAIILLLSAGVYAMAAALATRMHRDLLGPVHGERTAVGWRAVAAGARHVRARPVVAASLSVIAVSRFGYGLTTITTILLSRNYLNDPRDVEAGLSLLALVFGASGVGFILAALLTPAATERWGTSGWVWRCLALGALAQVVIVVRLSELIALGTAVLLGVAVQGIKICVDATLQREVDDDFRGRVFAFYDMVFNVAFVLAAALAALTVPSSGYSPPMWAAIAALYLLASAAYARTAARDGSAAVR